MKKNDPEGLRLDAARLFIELNQVLTEGNRISVIGFGETTNIYIEPTGVAKNKQEILEAVSSIRSDQIYTDMKDVLEKVRVMLDDRVKKNHAVVIFLTDGDLGIDDVPIPEDIKETENEESVKPRPPSREKDSQDEFKEDEDHDASLPEKEDMLNKYLEDYKEELRRRLH